MKEIMDFSLCLREHLKKVQPDEEKIIMLRKMAIARIKVIDQVVLDEETASVIAESYYETIKELLVALLLKDGYKSDNHECLISFFRQRFPQLPYEAQCIHELKHIRNRINYDGLIVRKSYIEDHVLEFRHIIRTLIDHTA